MTKLDERPFKIPFTKKCERRSVHPFVSKIPSRSVHRSQKMNGVRERRSFERRSLTLCLDPMHGAASFMRALWEIIQ